MKFHITLIHGYITLDSYFALFMFYIPVLNRCVVISHSSILFRSKSLYFMPKSKNIQMNFPNLVILGMAKKIQYQN